MTEPDCLSAAIVSRLSERTEAADGAEGAEGAQRARAMGTGTRKPKMFQIGRGANCEPRQLVSLTLCIVTIIIASCCVWRPNAVQAHYYSPSSGATNQQYATAGTEHLAQFEYATQQQQQAQQQQQLQPAHQSPFAMALTSISSAASRTQQQPLVDSSSAPLSGSGGSSSQSRSTRSIGEMFKKLFNANKRSKQSGTSSASPPVSSSSSSNSRDWEQQQQQQQQHNQQQQQQQFHQQQQSQQQALAAQLAVAAANQHAVYASPYATAASPPPGTLYAQNPFAASYSPGFLTWPTAGLAQAFRTSATPTYLTAASSAQSVGPLPPQMTLTGSSPLYAAASQSYSSYLPAPGQAPVGSSGQTSSSSAGISASISNPTVAASHTQVSAVPAPAGMMAAASQGHPSMVAGPGGGANNGGGGSPLNTIDFHQVLDALVRSSGFAPAGDGEAAYGSKGPEGTPVFSFKKLISMPFYLSTEDKSLDGLAQAGGGGGNHQGYLHSMPIMRRHVRRMSTAASGQQPGAKSHQQSQQQVNNPVWPSNVPSESVASYQQYSNYINDLNNQLAAMAATGNQQQQQMYDRQVMETFAAMRQQRPTTLGATATTSQASSMDASAAESALANYYANANNNGNRALTAPMTSRNSNQLERMIPSASMMSPVMFAQQPQQQQQPLSQKQVQRQSDEIQSFIYNLPQWLAESADQQTFMTIPAGSASVFMENNGNNNRFGSNQQAQNQQVYKSWPAVATGQQQQQQQQQQQDNQATNEMMAIMNQSGPAQQQQQVQQVDQSNQKDGQQAVEMTSSAMAQQQQVQTGNQLQGDSMQTQPSTLMSEQAAPAINHHQQQHLNHLQQHHHHNQQQQMAVSDSQQNSLRPSPAGATAADNNGQVVVVNGHHNQTNGSSGVSITSNQSVTSGNNSSGSMSAAAPTAVASLNPMFSGPIRAVV